MRAQRERLAVASASSCLMTAVAGRHLLVGVRCRARSAGRCVSMEGEMPNDNSLTPGYAPVNDLNAYFEIHGEGEPLVLLHGAYMNVDAMAPLLRPLAEHRQVIALELQGSRPDRGRRPPDHLRGDGRRHRG